MKLRFLLFSFFVYLSAAVFAQGTYTYSLEVFDQNQQPKSKLPVTLIETKTFKRKVFSTDHAGKLTIQLNSDEGAEWVMNVGDMRNYAVLQCSPYGTGKGSSSVTYDVKHWEKINQKPVDRSTAQIEDTEIRLPANVMPDKTHEVVEIILVSEKGRPYLGIEVKMVDLRAAKSFTTRTDAQGVARFKLPYNTSYQIDVDGEADFDYHNTGNAPYLRKKTLTYERINFEEKPDAEGYLVQTFREPPRPISNRVMVKLTVQGGSKQGKNETVYLKTNYSSVKYKGVTDQNNEVIFLLPKKKSYQVNFEFQRDAGTIDLSRVFGIGQYNATMIYLPDPRLEFPENYLPTKNDVNSYDMNNYITERYADTPDDNLINVHVKWGANKINSGSKEALLELGFSVKEPKNKKAISKPLNIAFVLDKSGSMSGEKIDFLRQAMNDFIEKLRPEDKVSIVFFDTEAILAYDKPTMDKSHLKDIIGAVQAGGGTSIYEGLKLGYEQVDKNKQANSVDRVLLLTDGYGSKPVDFILAESEKYFKKGIAVSTIGVGGGYNHSLLSMISEYSGGLNHQALHSAGISAALSREFESLLYPLATNLRVKVKYNNRVIYKTLYGIPESKKTDNTVQFELGRVFSSLNRMALMKFKIENPDRDIDKNKISIHIDYFDEVKQEAISIVKETALEWTDETDIEFVRDKQVRKTYSIAVINQTLKAIADFCDNKEYGQAKTMISESLKSLKKTNQSKFDADLAPLIEELENYLVYLDRAIKKG